LKGRTQDRSYQYQDFLRLYNEHDQIDQELLQALAVVHIPCTVKEFVSYVSNIQKSRCSSLSALVLESKILALCETPLVYTRGDTIQLRFELNQELYAKLVWGQKLPAFIKAIRQTFPLLDRLCTEAYDEALQDEVKIQGSECILFSLRYLLYHEDKGHNDIAVFIDYFEDIFPEEYQKKHPYLRIFDTPFQELWFIQFDGETTAKIHLCLLHQKMSRLQEPGPILESLEGLYQADDLKNSDVHTEVYHFLSIFYRLRGRPSSAWLNERGVNQNRMGWSLGVRAFQNLIEGNHENAMSTFHRAWREIRQDNLVQESFMESILGPFFILTALNQRQHNITNEQVLTLAAHMLIPVYESQRSPWGTHLIYPIVNQIIAPYVDQVDSELLEPTLSFRSNCSLLWLFEALYGLWHYGEDYSRMLKPLRKIYSAAKRSGYQWLEAEAGSLIAHLDPEDSIIFKETEALHLRLGTKSLTNLHPVRLGWRNLLERLRDVGQMKHQLDTRRGHSETTRLVWVTQHLPKANEFKFMPYIQQQANEGRGRRGHRQASWGKSKRIYLKDLYKAHIEQESYLTPQDHRVCAQLMISGEKARSDWEMFSDRDFKFDPKPSLLAIAGHNLLFLEAREKRGQSRKSMSLDSQKPVLKVIYPDESHLSLDFYPDLGEMPLVTGEESELLIKAEENHQYFIIECTGVHRQIAELLDQDIRIPRNENVSLYDVIDQLSQYVSVESDLGDMDGIIEHNLADSAPIVIFNENPGGGLKIQIRVQPFDQSEHLIRPGEGGKFMSNVIAGRRLSVERNLEEEIQKRTTLLEACPLFQQLESKGGDWEIRDREQYLELLLQINEHNVQLQEFEENLVRLRHPEGSDMNVAYPEVQQKSLSLQVKKESSSWFSLNGDLVISDDLRINVRELLQKERIGRFILLQNGEFIALEKGFAKTLDDLKESAEVSDAGVRFMTNSATLIRSTLDRLDETKIDGDRAWGSIVKKLNTVHELLPPDTLNATLRDYQLEGFRWLSGYALLGTGVGACLADDMGLGKTLQSLAVLLSRSEFGPSLVVAPTSVAQNWIIEASRFSPTLNVIRFAGTSEQREAIMTSLKSGDLLICTYGLLKTEVELVTRTQWNIVVLDEAQNIKNHTTQAAKAAVRLKSRFRFATTGTPIENNLTELWSLFQFLNPHLLKGIKDFRDRFLIPIEREDSSHARKRLNQIISPFVLRRTKESVLKDLPPLTEITLSVDLSFEERELYEGVMREKLDEIETRLSQGDNTARMQLFALLTKLRQLSCHPRLVFSDIDVPSSKLATFENLVHQLIAGGHKALVFSQFVKHLDLLKENLEHNQIAYQYLTGASSTKDRQKSVDAFQGGEGEVFLISLKAGGVGLNLTAADYVIHMDPWWNPAVEDQASDRAHRIGQERPVTVYRLVGKDTIEEQIVALHQNKRDLADAILEGSDFGLNSDALLDLLKAEMSGAGMKQISNGVSDRGKRRRKHGSEASI
jgi:SNF2 family DNA or RNA helicase